MKKIELGIYNVKGTGKYARQLEVVRINGDVVDIAYVAGGVVVKQRWSVMQLEQQIISFTGINDRSILALKNGEAQVENERAIAQSR